MKKVLFAIILFSLFMVGCSNTTVNSSTIDTPKIDEYTIQDKAVLNKEELMNSNYASLVTTKAVVDLSKKNETDAFKDLFANYKVSYLDNSKLIYGNLSTSDFKLFFDKDNKYIEVLDISVDSQNNDYISELMVPLGIQFNQKYNLDYLKSLVNDTYKIEVNESYDIKSLHNAYYSIDDSDNLVYTLKYVRLLEDKYYAVQYVYNYYKIDNSYMLRQFKYNIYEVEYDDLINLVYHGYNLPITISTTENKYEPDIKQELPTIAGNTLKYNDDINNYIVKVVDLNGYTRKYLSDKYDSYIVFVEDTEDNKRIVGWSIEDNLLYNVGNFIGPFGLRPGIGYTLNDVSGLIQALDIITFNDDNDTHDIHLSFMYNDYNYSISFMHDNGMYYLSEFEIVLDN